MTISRTALERTQCLCLPSMGLTDEALALMDPVSIAARISSGVADDSAVSMACTSSECVGEEKLVEELAQYPADNGVEHLSPSFELTEELLPVSGDHRSAEQVQRCNCEDDVQSLDSEEKDPRRPCMQQITDTMIADHLKTQEDGDAQTEDRSDDSG